MPPLRGLPDLSREDHAVLARDGHVAVAHGRRVTIYRPEDDGYHDMGRVDFDEPVTALAEWEQGLVIAAGPVIYHLDTLELRKVASVDGFVRSLATAGPWVFAAVGRGGRLDGTLLQADLHQSMIVSERSLDTAAVTLSTDPGGSFLGIADGTSFRTVRIADRRPCSGHPQANPPRPQPEPTPPACPCHCSEPEGQHETPPHDAHPGGQPGTQQPAEPCHPGSAGVPTPGGGGVVGGGDGVTHQPPDGVTWDTCRTQVFFDVSDLQVAAGHIIATDRASHNVAVLASSDLQILHRAQYRHGARVLAHHAQGRALVYQYGSSTWEYIDFGGTAGDANYIKPIDFALLDESITFTGSPLPVLRGDRAPAIGTKRVLVIPTIDPGQTFDDTGLARFAAYCQRAGFAKVRDYYRENSFGLLNNIEFAVFGVDVGSGGPVQLPKPVADYYFPAYVGAHVDLVKSGLSFPTHLVFDGRETMTLNLQPQTNGRPATKLHVRLTALLASAPHPTFPAEIRFLGTETATITVTRPGGAVTALTLHFTPKVVQLNSVADLAPKLADLENYLEAVLLAAETSAGVSPRLFAKPRIRRIDQGPGGPGLIVTTLTHTKVTGSKLEVRAVSYTGAKDPLGFVGAYTGRMPVGAGDNPVLRTYLDYVTVLAQEDAGVNYNQRRLAKDPVVDGDPATGKLTSTLYISEEDGGPGASLSVTDLVETGALFDTVNAVVNTAVTAGRSSVPKDGDEGFDGLLDDVFTGIVDRLVSPLTLPFLRNVVIHQFVATFDMVIVGPVLPAETNAEDADFPRPDEMWNAGPTSWHGGLRPVEGPRTARYRPDKQLTFFSNWNLVPLRAKPEVAAICHEFGHAIGFDDLYPRQAGYRDDLIYMGPWAMMHDHRPEPHHCGYHKWQAGWIPDERVHTVHRPPEDQTASTEVLLVPVEHWHPGDTLVGAARAAFGTPHLPVVQLVELSLGGGADVFGLIEARQRTSAFSKGLPLNPAVLISQCIVWWDKTRYSFNGRYRAPVHLLHSYDRPNDEGKPYFATLQNAGDSFDLARGRVLPVKGIVVTIVKRQTVAGVEVFHLKIDRTHSKEFIDLCFTSSDPYYKNPDLWVDWAGDNGPGGKTSSRDEKDVRVFPLGQPDHQGEPIRVPPSGDELHWMVARLRNLGNVHAVAVKLNYSVCEPPGAGDHGNFKVVNTVIRDVVNPTGQDNPMIVPAAWNIPAGLKGHTCIMVEIADSRAPLNHTGAAMASADVREANGTAQKNVSKIGPVRSSPFAPVRFEFSVNNSAQWPEVAYLEPEGLPYGMRLTVTPRRRTIAAGETAIFRCKLELDDRAIDAGCRSDHDFRINAWRVDEDASILWGGVEYQVRPRKRTTTDISGTWYEDDVEITGQVEPDNVTGRVRIRLAYANHHARWVSVALKAGATFSYQEKCPPNTRLLQMMAMFEGNRYYAESRSPERKISPPKPLH